MTVFSSAAAESGGSRPTRLGALSLGGIPLVARTHTEADAHGQPGDAETPRHRPRPVPRGRLLFDLWWRRPGHRHRRHDRTRRLGRRRIRQVDANPRRAGFGADHLSKHSVTLDPCLNPMHSRVDGKCDPPLVDGKLSAIDLDSWSALRRAFAHFHFESRQARLDLARIALGHRLPESIGQLLGSRLRVSIRAPGGRGASKCRVANPEIEQRPRGRLELLAGCESIARRLGLPRLHQLLRFLKELFRPNGGRIHRLRERGARKPQQRCNEGGSHRCCDASQASPECAGPHDLAIVPSLAEAIG